MVWIRDEYHGGHDQVCCRHNPSQGHEFRHPIAQVQGSGGHDVGENPLGSIPNHRGGNTTSHSGDCGYDQAGIRHNDGFWNPQPERDNQQ